jgi:fumarylacetoacetate (FAA) hydrolase
VKLATLRDETKTGRTNRDGKLIVVRHDGQVFEHAPTAWPTMQSALDDWTQAHPALMAISDDLAAHVTPGQKLDVTKLMAPLPRAYEWVDGSAFLNHVILVRKARGAEPPPTLNTDPLVYQGGSSDMMGPTAPILLADEKWGLDYESEVCVILGDTPQGTAAADAGKYVRLVLLANDCTLRNLVPNELAKGFGFFQSKPATAFSPFAVTPDELAPSWRDGRLHMQVRSMLNGTQIGDCNAGPEMHFSFHYLIAHITRTRKFTAGTILGSGTVSNEDRARGISCLAEARMIETIEGGAPVTPFMKVGDQISISAIDQNGHSPFGEIKQTVVAGSAT